jgi:hypothetical protein
MERRRRCSEHRFLRGRGVGKEQLQLEALMCVKGSITGEQMSGHVYFYSNSKSMRFVFPETGFTDD